MISDSANIFYVDLVIIVITKTISYNFFLQTDLCTSQISYKKAINYINMQESSWSTDDKPELVHNSRLLNSKWVVWQLKGYPLPYIQLNIFIFLSDINLISCKSTACWNDTNYPYLIDFIIKYMMPILGKKWWLSDSLSSTNTQ
jgi:hypothetical protein